MTRALATVTSWVALTAVLLVSGGYTVHYLLAWQWSRAEFAATAFVASLVACAVLLVLTRLRRMEERLERRLASLTARGTPSPARSAATPPAARQPEGESDGEPRPRLPWLTDTRIGLAAAPLAAAVVLIRDRTPDHGVFIPVFLASGLLVSAVAASVERLAARRSGQQPTTRRLRPGTLVTAAVAGAALAATTVGALYWTAHYWGGSLGAGRTSFELEVRHHGVTPGKGPVAAAAGSYCTLDAGLGARYRSVGVRPDGRVRLVVTPALDDDAVARLGGCLQDAILDGHTLVVHDVRVVTADRSRAEGP
jgi:hypothetical protein